eukprot:13608-Heterococcus_DN1.PRE.2
MAWPTSELTLAGTVYLSEADSCTSSYHVVIVAVGCAVALSQLFKAAAALVVALSMRSGSLSTASR